MERDENAVRALVEKSSRLTIEFLNTDLDLGFTFCETARIESDLDPPAVLKLTEKIRAVLRTVEQFLPRVHDEIERQAILARADRLEGELRTLEIQTDPSTAPFQIPAC